MDKKWWKTDKTWPTGEGNDKPLQHSCLENPMNSMKRQKNILSKKIDPPRSVGVQYATREEQKDTSKKNEEVKP